MSQVQLEAFFLVQNAYTAFPSTLVSMLELSLPLPILLLLRIAGLSGLNTLIVDIWLTDGGEVVSLTCELPFTPRKLPEVLSMACCSYRVSEGSASWCL
jgi:hypothetical protein